MEQAPILFFDGMCNLCNGFINLLVAMEFKGKFAPLQGLTARGLLPQAVIAELSSLVYLRKGELHREAQAVRWVLHDSPAPLRFLGWISFLLPEVVINKGYRWVAKNRYRLFGKRETCRLPTPEERERFLP